MTDLPESLAAFIDRGEARDLSLAVVNRTHPQTIHDMVAERRLPDADEDLVLLLEGGEVVASSPLSALEDEILLVNSDLYSTGTKSLEDATVPDVIANVEETAFRLRGYPASHSEKLPLIIVSRYIERVAWKQGSGRLQSSFQRLFRLDDEHGTRAVYEQLAETGLDVHVYGVPDWVPPPSFSGVVHAGYHGEFRSSWFVVYHSEDDDRTAALVAERVADDEWEALWTVQPGRVRAVNATSNGRCDRRRQPAPTARAASPSMRRRSNTPATRQARIPPYSTKCTGLSGASSASMAAIPRPYATTPPPTAGRTRIRVAQANAAPRPTAAAPTTASVTASPTTADTAVQ
ncbi:DICT sensory domain-containing protein [Haloplanus halobius]|uniref:DICT sensory domain-containing protein n=1 Tax=Haloplanus halobius TaxID=2934938 RepID=UPI00200E4AE4|nr:DICT sensory domain-containing protein [Haloplanus sp. XH21]